MCVCVHVSVCLYVCVHVSVSVCVEVIYACWYCILYVNISMNEFEYIYSQLNKVVILKLVCPNLQDI